MLTFLRKSGRLDLGSVLHGEGRKYQIFEEKFTSYLNDDDDEDGDIKQCSWFCDFLGRN